MLEVSVHAESRHAIETSDEDRLLPHDQQPSLPLDVKAQPWTPIALRPASLYALASLYVTLAMGLIVLVVVDHKKQGLATSREGLHYLWTYGPTLVLSVLATFWNHIDYRTRQLLPWSILRKGPTPASDTLLIDYTSASDAIVLWECIKARQFPVLITTTTTWLLKLLIVLSTSLLSLQRENVTLEGTNLTSTDHFDNSSWAETRLQSLAPLFAYGHTKWELEYPAGTSSFLAIPTFKVARQDQRMSTDTVDTTVDSLQVSLDSCQEASVRHNRNGTQIHTDTCGSHQLNNTRPFFHSVSVRVFGVACGENDSKDHVGIFLITDNRQHAFLANGSENPDNIGPVKPMVWVCEVALSFAPAAVKLDMTGNIVHGEQLHSSKDTPLVSAESMIDRVLGSTQNVGEQLWYLADDDQSILTDFNVSQYNSDQFFLLYLVTYKPKDLDELSVSETFLADMKSLFSVVAAQTAKQNLMTPGEIRLKGTLHTVGLRIRVQSFSVYWIVGILVVLSVSAIALSMLVPQGSTHCDPGPIFGQAAILARSPDLQRVLNKTGMYSIPELRQLLEVQICEVKPGNHRMPAIELHKIVPRMPTSNLKRKLSPWWVPWSLSVWARLIFVAGVLTVMISLEASYARSVQKTGLADIDHPTSTRYAWRLVPGTVMLGVSTLLSVIAADSKLVLPYHELRQTSASTMSTIRGDHRSRFAVAILWLALKDRHWPILAVVLGATAAFPLTIVSSGLFTSHTYNSTDSVTYDLKVLYNFTNPGSTWDPQAVGKKAFDLALLQSRNMSYPPWIFGEYLLPRISISPAFRDAFSNDSLAPGSILELEGLAWKASAACELVASESVSVKDVGPLGITSAHNISATFPHACSNGDQSFGFAETTFVHNWTSGEVVQLWKDSWNDRRVPYTMLLYGKTPENLESGISDLNVMLCCSRMHIYDVMSIFEVPSLDIVDVKAHEGRAREVREVGVDRIYTAMTEAIRTMWSDDENTLPPFFSAALSQYPDTTLDDLMARDNSSMLADAASKIWSLAFPPMTDMLSRVDWNDHISFLPGTVLGTIYQPDRTRLVQNAVSTYILTALLGFIVACVAVLF
ncbi:hypothetical protein CKM354_000278100 [Cercospora kikuchii]|uniref:Transmembrane protein n=1 Tax=Cercospora kikuchii TaxID=84275 RepID=A0A9P3CFD1_9PEZI|nr:uncharacterized protein CKM354_000278100 [Cercospora kikuchii]GIZ39395.1 hypothetical protein CKM354_000278100 [Cercospora kikuchii]